MIRRQRGQLMDGVEQQYRTGLLWKQDKIHNLYLERRQRKRNMEMTLKWRLLSIMLFASWGKAVTITHPGTSDQHVMCLKVKTSRSLSKSKFRRNQQDYTCRCAFHCFQRVQSKRRNRNNFRIFDDTLYVGGFHPLCDGKKPRSFSRTRVRRMSRPLDEGVRPFPTMPSQQFLSLAQSQLELLASCLQQQNGKSQSAFTSSSSSSPPSSSSKAKSIALYLPRENVRTGQLEFVPVVLYPDITSRRIFIAPESSSSDLPFIPRTLPTLPGFTHASSILPRYPFASAVQKSNPNQIPNAKGYQRGFDVTGETFETHSASSSAGIGAVEEVTSGTMYSESNEQAPPLEDGNLLSVSLFKGSQTIGVLLVWPASTKVGLQNAGSDFGVSASYTNQLSSSASDRTGASPNVNIGGRSSFWSEDDRQQVSRAAYTLSVALSMDSETMGTMNNPYGLGYHPYTFDGSVMTGRSNETYAPYSLSYNTYQDLLKVQARETSEMRDNLADNLHQVKNPLQALRTFGKLLQRRLALEEFSQGSSSDSAALRDLAERMMFQTDRVIDLLQPIEGIVDRLDSVSQSSSSMLSLPPSSLESIDELSEQYADKRPLVLKPFPDVVVNQPMEKSQEVRAKIQTFEPNTSQVRAGNSTGDADEAYEKLDFNATDSRRPFIDLLEDERNMKNADTALNNSSSSPSAVTSAHSILDEPQVEMAFVPDIIEPVLRASEAVATEKGIRFEIIPIKEDDLPGVIVCPKSLQEALTNVLDNSIKYICANDVKSSNKATKQENPHIRVSVLPNPPDSKRGVSIIVEDNGPGIPEDEREKIFSRGFRTQRTQHLPGQGIGLDISRALLSKFQAEIKVLDGTSNILKGAVMRIMLFSSLS